MDRNLKIYAATLSGKTYAEIAREHGIGKQRVNQIVSHERRKIQLNIIRAQRYWLAKQPDPELDWNDYFLL